MPFLKLDVAKDGLAYCIDATTVDNERIEAILSEVDGGWGMVECTRGRPLTQCDSWRLGRRKSWTKALAEALDLLEATAKGRES